MKTLQNISALFALSLLAACSGGGGGGGATVQGSLAGTATKGPVGNATVVAYAIGNGQMGSQIGTATTDVNGNFTVAMGGYAGPVMLQVSGGTYMDEATGTVMTMAPGDVMTALMPGFTAGATVGGIQVTPVTAMAQAMALAMAGGMTEANITAANAAMGNYFSVGDILHTPPMNPLMTGAGNAASQDARNYGMTLAAMSQYAQSQGLGSSSAMVTAMLHDASDGFMNGQMGANPITLGMGGMMGGGMMQATAGTAGLASAMATFMNSNTNASGLTLADMAALMQQLATASGQI